MFAASTTAATLLCFLCVTYVIAENARLPKVVFGIVSSQETFEAKFMKNVMSYWKEGYRGTLFFDFLEDAQMARVPKGMDQHSHIYVTAPGEDPHELPWGYTGAMTFKKLYESYPDAEWFVWGDDDTFFVVDNLLADLSGRDPEEPWYIGTLSEKVHLKQLFGGIFAYGGGGIIVSRGTLRIIANSLKTCARKVAGTHPDETLGHCVLYAGVPLTIHPGMHQADEGSRYLDYLQHQTRVAPLLTVHRHYTALPNAMKKAIALNPSGFAQQTLGYHLDPSFPVVSITSGVSIKIWGELDRSLSIRYINIPSRAGISSDGLHTHRRPPPVAEFTIKDINITDDMVTTTYGHKSNWNGTSLVVVREPVWPDRWKHAAQRLCIQKLEKDHTAMTITLATLASKKCRSVFDAPETLTWPTCVGGVTAGGKCRRLLTNRRVGPFWPTPW